MIAYEYQDHTLWLTEEEYFDTTEEEFAAILQYKLIAAINKETYENFNIDFQRYKEED